MSTIPYTKDMNKFIIESAKKVGITKTNLGLTLGLADTYFCKQRNSVQQENWNKTLAFFEKHGISFKPSHRKSIAQTDNSVFDRFRSMAAEPGASPAHLKKVFGISSSTYTRIVAGENGRRARNILKAVFAKLDKASNALATPSAPKKVNAAKTGKVVLTGKSSMIQTVATAFKLQTQLKALLASMEPDSREELMSVLFAPNA